MNEKVYRVLEYNKIKENPDYLLSIIPNVLIKEKQNVKTP